MFSLDLLSPLLDHVALGVSGRSLDEKPGFSQSDYCLKGRDISDVGRDISHVDTGVSHSNHCLNVSDVIVAGLLT